MRHLLHWAGNAKLEALPDLMIETMIAEAVLPIAATGSFGHMSGLDFLQMILRKAYWLNEHRRILVKGPRLISPLSHLVS